MGIFDKLSEMIDGKKFVAALETLNENIHALNKRLSEPSTLPQILRPAPQVFSLCLKIGEARDWNGGWQSSSFACVREVSCDLSDPRFRMLIQTGHGPMLSVNMFAFRFGPVELDQSAVSTIPMTILVERNPDAPEMDTVSDPTQCVVIIKYDVMKTDPYSYPGARQSELRKAWDQHRLRARRDGQSDI